MRYTKIGDSLGADLNQKIKKKSFLDDPLTYAYTLIFIQVIISVFVI